MDRLRAVTPQSGPEVAVFVSGVSSLGLEILAGRIVAPAFGSSIYVWGSIIGVFLAALALGYHRGGERAATRASTRAIVTVLLASALYVAGLLALAGIVVEMADAFSVPPRLAPLLPIAILFGPPVYLLGLISPYAAELLPAESAGGASGRIYAVGTAGSIVGAFGTTFVLIPWVDLAIAEAGFGLLLVATAVGLVWNDRREGSGGIRGSGREGRGGRGSRDDHRVTGLRDDERGQLYLRGLLVALAITGGFALHDNGLAVTGDVVVKTETPYQGLTVVDRGARELGNDRTVRTLYLDGTPQSATYLEDGEPVASPYVFDYTRYFHLAVAMSDDDFDRVLFVGGGGFSGPRRFAAEYPNVTVDVVELDPVVIDVAKEHFGVRESARFNVYQGDGREFLERTNRTYDAIVLDAYRKDRVPFHMATAEFMDLAAERLDSDGVLVANVISAASGPGSQFFRAEYATMQSAFPHVYAFPTVGGPVVQNVELVATKREDGFSREELAARIERRDVGVPLDDAPRRYRNADDVRTDDVPVLRDDRAPVDRLLDPQLGRRYVISRNGTVSDASAPGAIVPGASEMVPGALSPAVSWRASAASVATTPPSAVG